MESGGRRRRRRAVNPDTLSRKLWRLNSASTNFCLFWHQLPSLRCSSSGKRTNLSFSLYFSSKRTKKIRDLWFDSSFHSGRLLDWLGSEMIFLAIAFVRKATKKKQREGCARGSRENSMKNTRRVVRTKNERILACLLYSTAESVDHVSLVRFSTRLWLDEEKFFLLSFFSFRQE